MSKNSLLSITLEIESDKNDGDLKSNSSTTNCQEVASLIVRKLKKQIKLDNNQKTLKSLKGGVIVEEQGDVVSNTLSSTTTLTTDSTEGSTVSTNLSSTVSTTPPTIAVPIAVSPPLGIPTRLWTKLCNRYNSSQLAAIKHVSQVLGKFFFSLVELLNSEIIDLYVSNTDVIRIPHTIQIVSLFSFVSSELFIAHYSQTMLAKYYCILVF